MLKIIQIGLCFCDEEGNPPEGIHTWQFNFRFSLRYSFSARLYVASADPGTKNSDDMFARESIDLLTAAGINFQQHLEHGIDSDTFAELFISSGLVLSDDVRWISFHRLGRLASLTFATPG